MYFDPLIHRDVVNRIHRISGRFTGLEKMLPTRDAYEICIQLLATEAYLKIFSQIMDDAFRADVNIYLHTPHPRQLQTPGWLQHLENIKVQLPQFTAQQLLRALYDIRQKKLMHT